VTDLWRASGGADKDKPTRWLELTKTSDLIATLSNDIGVSEKNLTWFKHGGTTRGSWAHEDLAFADCVHPITRNDQGLVSLTDLWRASGGVEKHKPNNWLNLLKTKELQTALSRRLGSKLENQLCSQRGGRSPGTFAHEKLAIAYAMWISPDFQLAVIDAFQDYWALRTGGQNVVDILPAALSKLSLFVITDISKSVGSDHVHFHPHRPELGRDALRRKR